jgi:sodium transport system permease protein
MNVNRWKNICLIWFKELRSLKRDKKALLTIFLPIVIYPVIMMFFFGVSSVVEGNLGGETRQIGYKGQVSEQVQEAIEAEGNVEIVEGDFSDPLTSINDARVDVIVEEHLEGDVLHIHLTFNETMDKSVRGKNLIVDRLETYRDDHINASIEALDLDQNVLELVTRETVELTEESESNRVLASVLGLVAPFILIMYSIIGMYAIASDLSAGEKERFTLETIFSVPVPKQDIIIGKLFAGVSIGLLSGLTNIISMFPIAYAIAAMIPDLQLSFGILLPLFVFVMLLPVMFLTCSVMLGMGLFAKTYQEAQTYGSFVMIAFMLPGYIGMIPDIELTNRMAMLPVTNAMLVMREAFIGNYPVDKIMIVLGVNTGLALTTVLIMSKLFSSESVIFGLKKPSFLGKKRVRGGSTNE